MYLTQKIISIKGKIQTGKVPKDWVLAVEGDILFTWTLPLAVQLMQLPCINFP